MIPVHPGLRDRPVYLDYNATTPTDPRVFNAMTPYLTVEFGNPSSNHAYGRSAAGALELARGQVAALITAQPHEIVFTGSGSEADALAIEGSVLVLWEGETAHHHAGDRTSRRPGRLRPPRAIPQCRRDGHGVDRDGLVDPAAVAAAIKPNTVLVTIMHANNETGTIQSIAEIAMVTRVAGCCCTATQHNL